MRRSRAGLAVDRPGGGRPRPRALDHLPRHHPSHERARGEKPMPSVRDTRRHRLPRRDPPHAPLHGGLVPHLPHLPALRVPQRPVCVLHRRMLHRRHALPGPLPHRRAVVRPHAHGRRARQNGHLRNRGDRHEPVFGQGGAGHQGEA
ncbi:Uncharacterised protein [Chlamydia trachomatis]|nr:Uncharacterised protein [Chlamydia trachomatis]